MYELYCKDIHVMSLSKKGDAVVHNKQLMPFGIHITDNSISNIISFYDWCEYRYMDTSHLSILQDVCSMRNASISSERVELCINNNCLTLHDSYWVTVNESVKCWKDINMFDICVGSNPDQLIDELGSFYDKTWVGRNLYEKDVNHVKVQCSDILTLLNYSHVRYDAKGAYSVSRAVSTEDVGIVSAKLYKLWCESNGIDFISKCLTIDKRHFLEMIISDYLIGNTGRTLSEWGVYRSAYTGEVLGLYPITSSNCSFSYGYETKSFIMDMSMREAAIWAINQDNSLLDAINENVCVNPIFDRRVLELIRAIDTNVLI